MSYTQDKNGDIIIKGFQNGIADSQYSGLANIRNINTISVPGEASVQFATTRLTQETSVLTPFQGTVVSADDTTDTVTITFTNGTFDSGSAITFAGGSLPTGIVAGTIYWAVVQSVGVYKLYTDYARSALLNITATGTGTWSMVSMSKPKYFEKLNNSYHYMLDASGRVWSNQNPTVGGYWTYMGNKPNNESEGNGLVLYKSSSAVAYLFAFSRSSVDYSEVGGTVAWQYQWNPAAGATAAWAATATPTLKATGIQASHEAIVAPDNRVYFCDANYIGRFYQTDPAVAFVPTTLSTYTYDTTPILPFDDVANCLTFLGTSIIVGGQKNILYPWDRFSNQFSFPILLAEYNVKKLVTVNTNTYIFVGNRGRIYVTNGSNASLYKKIPDDISGTIEPYFEWGGATWNKNQIYFSFKATTNGGVDNYNYGGVWAVDTDTNAIRLTNTLSTPFSATITPYATAISPNFGNDPAGAGLFIGWDNRAATFGIDGTLSTPYTDGSAIVDGDLIPIGTVLKPTTNGRVEFKLAVPIVSGESVKLQYRQSFDATFTDISSTTLFNYSTYQSSYWNGYSGAYTNVPFQNGQWIQIRAVLTSTASSPSYVRLTELRIGQ